MGSQFTSWVPYLNEIAIRKYGYKNIFLAIVPCILLFSLVYGILAILIPNYCDSTTRNSLLPVDKRYPTVLQDILRTQYEQSDIEVFNAGMDY